MKRDEDGRYREAHASAASRDARAREETQTHSGTFTHTRNAAERRMPLDCTVPSTVPLFRDKRFNRSSWKPKV